MKFVLFMFALWLASMGWAVYEMAHAPEPGAYRMRPGTAEYAAAGARIYRCRLCGAVWEEPNVRHIIPRMIEAARRSAHDLTLLDIHACPDGRLGVSDLIGARIR